MSTQARYLGSSARGIAAVLLIAATFSCSGESVEQRARDAAEKLQGSMQSPAALALRQEVSPEQVKEAQEALTLAKEYMGDVNGVLDSVTVNAIQAFQRTHGLADDGILNERTTTLLRRLKAQSRAQAVASSAT